MENNNGIIKRYFPERRDFDKITDEQIQFVEDRINNRPMKFLGYKSLNKNIKNYNKTWVLQFKS